MVSVRNLILFLLLSSGLPSHANVVLEVVCDNTLAFQTNFQKKFFDSYNAATDSMSSRFVIQKDAKQTWTVEQFYPADKSSAYSAINNGVILNKSFYNLESKQAFLEGIMRSKNYTNLIALHRSKNGDWALQVTLSGNSEGNLFHRMYFYECITLEDNFKGQD